MASSVCVVSYPEGLSFQKPLLISYPTAQKRLAYFHFIFSGGARRRQTLFRRVSSRIVRRRQE